MRLLLWFSLSCAAGVWCYDMIVGDTVHRKMVFHQRVKTFAIPLKKRISTLTYRDADKRPIKVFTSFTLNIRNIFYMLIKFYLIVILYIHTYVRKVM